VTYLPYNTKFPIILKLEAPTPRGDESKQKVVRVCSGKPILTLWGSSHLAPHRGLGLNVEDGLRSSFHRMINLSKGGMKLTSQLTDEIVTAIRSHPGHKQVYVFLLGGHNMRKTTKPILEVAKVV